MALLVFCRTALVQDASEGRRSVAFADHTGVLPGQDPRDSNGELPIGGPGTKQSSPLLVLHGWDPGHAHC